MNDDLSKLLENFNAASNQLEQAKLHFSMLLSEKHGGVPLAWREKAFESQNFHQGLNEAEILQRWWKLSEMNRLAARSDARGLHVSELRETK